MAERIALIVNPAATRAGGRLLHDAEAALAPLGLIDVAMTAHAGHGAELARAARDAGATLVVPLGGDGTVNEVAEALAGTPAALAPLPAGSTNVFARALGWPHPADRALPELVRALADPRWREVTLGRVRAGGLDRVFCVNAGIGLDAETVRMVESRPWIKTRFRHAGFAAVTVVAAVRELTRAPRIACRIDGGAPAEFAALIAACGAPYAYFGPRPLDLVPGADFGPRLRWLGLTRTHPGAVAAAVAGALRGGRHVTRPGVATGWAEREILLGAGPPAAVQADGEPLGRHGEVLLTPGPALRTLLPPPGR